VAAANTAWRTSPYAPSTNQPAAFAAAPLLQDGKVEMIVALPLSHIDAIVVVGLWLARRIGTPWWPPP
jgi:hypothetical protein